MSSGEELKADMKLRGGHAPAEKISGGVRIARKIRAISDSDGHEKISHEAVHDSGDSDNEHMEGSRNILAHSGLAAQTKKDYPKDAIRAYHEKPMPKHQKPTTITNTVLFQPTKQ